MRSLSRRWVPHLTALLVLTLIPVALHGYVGLESDDCAHATAIAPPWSPDGELEGTDAYIDERMKPSQWREGVLRDSEGAALSYTIARGFDAKHIYYRPEYKLVRESRPVSHEIDWIDVDGERIPVHRPIYEHRLGRPLIGIAAYVILYGGDPVEDPYRTQLLSAPLQIVRGRLAATLLFVSGFVLETERVEAEQRAYAWLESAVRRYREVCSP